MFFESLIVTLGIVLIVEGIPWFLSPHGTKRMLSEVFRMNDQTLRGFGLILMLFGLVIVYMAKS
jgi:uncharacterized protein YjeT (DUF2065 family)